MQDYQVLRKLGESPTSEVFLAMDKRTKMRVAIKVCPTAAAQTGANDVRREIGLMGKLDHPNIVRYYGCFEEHERVHIVMEWVDAGDLSAAIELRRGRQFTDDEVMRMFCQMILGLSYLHSCNVLHRDLKPANLFISRLGVLKIGDFGVAREMQLEEQFCKTALGSPYYIAPCVFDAQAYSFPADVWSAGVVLYELATLRRPYNASSIVALVAAIFQNRRDPVEGRPPELVELIDSLLVLDPSGRPTAAEILARPFVARHIERLVRENTQKLGKGKAKKGKKGRKLQIEPILPETELPLPAECLPSWALRLIEEQSRDIEEEVHELEASTRRLQSGVLRADVERRLGAPLLAMIFKNLETGGRESEDFLAMLALQDAEGVAAARRLHDLERDMV